MIEGLLIQRCHERQIDPFENPGHTCFLSAYSEFVLSFFFPSTSIIRGLKGREAHSAPRCQSMFSYPATATSSLKSTLTSTSTFPRKRPPKNVFSTPHAGRPKWQSISRIKINASMAERQLGPMTYME